MFHGLVSRQELVRLICSAKICINPHVVSQTPGNVFAFKIIEYLAAGAHVITTPMGALEQEIEVGITYMPDNKAETIAATLKQVIQVRCYERTAAQAALQTYRRLVRRTVSSNNHSSKLLYQLSRRRKRDQKGIEALGICPLGPK